MNTILLLGHILFNTIGPIANKEVYICNNKKAEKYHYSATCRGLSNCQFKIIKTTVFAAKKEGMTLCSWESKKKK